MAKIKPLASIVEKWTRRTPLATPDYEQGIKVAADWAAMAAAGNDAWKGGVQAAIARDGFAKGVRRAGTPKWLKKTLDKGPARWGPGVQIAGSDYEAGFSAPHRDIEAAKLSPRYANRDPRNLTRVKDVVDSLIAGKLKRMG